MPIVINVEPVFLKKYEKYVMEVITSRKLKHVHRCLYEYGAVEKENHKLELIEQPKLDKIHSR